MFPKQTRIIFVDDMSMFRTMVKNALRELGFTNFVEADDGEQAWTLIAEARTKNQPFELIISDWTMPKMKGIDLLKKVRAEPWGKGFPFLMLTGETEKQMILEAIENKVSQYIIKPFTVNQLKEKLEATHVKWVAETGAKKSA